VLQARIEADTARLRLVAARNWYGEAWRRLAAVLGCPDMQPATLTGDPVQDLPELSFEDSLGRLLAQSPELSRARAGLERARCNLALQHARALPNFQVGSGVKYDYSTRDTLVDVEVGLPIPLFDRNQGNITAAEAQLLAAEREVRRVDLDLRSRLAKAFAQYATARRQVEIYTGSILPDARDSLDLVGTGYRAGEFSYLRLLAAQVTYFNVNLTYLNNLWELWARSVQIEGLLLAGGLDATE
jgi:cobalt-zinc-cadmium efflux system outer membrane protein